MEIELLKPKDKLKPCPFCGGKARLVKVEDWHDCARVPSIYYGIGCDTADCRCERDGDEYFLGSEKEATEQWNKRP